MKCKKCGEVYRLSDPADCDWEPSEGRCYECQLLFLLDMYGWALEPTFQVSGVIYDKEGPLT